METNIKSSVAASSGINIDDDTIAIFNEEFAEHSAEDILVALHRAVQE
jgi:hypothetical protein